MGLRGRVLLSLLATLMLSASWAAANVIGPEDGRGVMSVLGPELGFSQTEIERAGRAIGFVACPGTKANNPAVGTGVLVGSTPVLVTVAHVFAEKDGTLREPLSECYFYNQPISGEPDLVSIDPSRLFLGAAQMAPGNGNDFAVVRLARPVRNAIPYQPAIDVSRYEIVSRPLILVSASQPQVNNDDKVQVVQRCAVRDIDVRGRYISDCDAEPLASGGPALVKRDGEYFVAAVLSATGKQKLNGRPYDPSTGSFTALIPLQAEFLDVVNALGSGRPLPATNAYRSD